MAIPFHPAPSVPDENEICLVCKEPSDELICSAICDDVWNMRQEQSLQYDIDPEEALYA